MLAATVVVSAGDLRTPAALAVLLLVSGVVFWIAHVYAATVAGRHGGWHVGSIRAGMRHEWPVAFAAVPPAIAAAVCGLVPGVSVTDGAWAALLVAIGEQQLWGYAAVGNAKLSGAALTGTVLLNVVMGVIIVALKFAVGPLIRSPQATESHRDGRARRTRLRHRRIRVLVRSPPPTRSCWRSRSHGTHA